MRNLLDSESSFLTVQPHFNLGRFRKPLVFRTTIYSFRPRGSHYSDNMLLGHPELANLELICLQSQTPHVPINQVYTRSLTGNRTSRYD
jgi:hypothetical protein